MATSPAGKPTPPGKLDIVNRSVSVYREDGTRLYGFDAELELQRQSKRDLDFEKELVKWIEKVLEEPLENADDIGEALKSGVVLCKLINKLAPGTIPKYNTRPIALMQLENINLYLKAAAKLGLGSEDMFVASDLHSKKDLSAVVKNIYSLARLAPSLPTFKGPKLEGVKPAPKPLADLKKAPKWDIPSERKIIHIADIERSEAEEERLKLLAEIEELKSKLAAASSTPNPTTDAAALAAERTARTNLEMELKEAKRQLSAANAALDAERATRAKVEGEVKDLRQQLSKVVATSSTPSPAIHDKELHEMRKQLQDEVRKRERVEEELRDIKRRKTNDGQAVSTPTEAGVEPMDIDTAATPPRHTIRWTWDYYPVRSDATWEWSVTRLGRRRTVHVRRKVN